VPPSRARWFDPATLRWMSQDPMGFDAGDSNLYRYVTNRPTLNRDPSGLLPPNDPLSYAFEDPYLQQGNPGFLPASAHPLSQALVAQLERMDEIGGAEPGVPGNTKIVQGIDWRKKITQEKGKYYIVTTWGYKLELGFEVAKDKTWCHTCTFGGLDNPVGGKYYHPTPSAIGFMLTEGEKQGRWQKIPDKEAKAGDIVIWRAKGDAIAKEVKDLSWAEPRMIHSATIVKTPKAGGLDPSGTLLKSKDGQVPVEGATSWAQQKLTWGYGLHWKMKGKRWDTRVADYEVWRFIPPTKK
jgi:uncharacterized protein RhaS with RHS repeats